MTHYFIYEMTDISKNLIELPHNLEILKFFRAHSKFSVITIRIHKKYTSEIVSQRTCDDVSEKLNGMRFLSTYLRSFSIY